MRYRQIGDHALLLDLAGIVLISGAILGTGRDPLMMLVWVTVVVSIRTVVWAFLPHGQRDGTLAGELLTLLLCLAIGACNDWNSVHRHDVYAYTTPALFPAHSAVPLWMLLYWSLIVRFVATVARWRRLGPHGEVPDIIRIGSRRHRSPAIRLGLQLVVILIARQFIYRYHGDPVLSWLPFAGGLLVMLCLLPLSTPQWRLLLALAVLGPIVEVLYIQWGQLHHYSLGWILGVPVWIISWWILGGLVWSDIYPRLRARIEHALAREQPSA